MPTIAEQLQELVNQKNALAENLNNKGIEASTDEKLNTLVPKVLQIETGGGYDTSDANVSPSDIVKDKVAYGFNGRIEGTMPINVTKSYTPSKDSQTIPAGYHPEEQTIYGDSDLIPGNIKAGLMIFGVSGSFTADGTAGASDILNGKKAYVNGQLVTGNIPLKGGQSYRPTKEDQTIISGQYLNGDQVIEGDENLTAENIKAGVSIFGIPGSYSGSDLSDANATKYDILSGKTAYTGNGLITGVAESLTDDELLINPTVEKQVINGPKFIEANKQLVVNPVSVDAESIAYGKTVFGVEGTFTQLSSSEAALSTDVLSGKKYFVNGAEKTGTMEKINGRTITPSSSQKQLTSYDCYLSSPYTIPAEPNMIPDNIKAGVSIYGVEGTYTEPSGTKTGASEDEIAYGKTAFVNGTEVTGTAELINSYDYYPKEYNQTISGPKLLETGKTITFYKPDIDAASVAYGQTLYGVTGTYTQLSSSEAAIASQVLSGKKYFVNGEQKVGTLKSVEGSVITPTTIDQYTDAKVLLNSHYTIKGDENLTAENIKAGVSIFGVNGSYEAGTIGYDTSDATVTEETLLEGVVAYGKDGKIVGTFKASEFETFNPEESYIPSISPIELDTTNKHVTGNIIIEGDENLTAENIKAGVSIFGVNGSYEGSGGSSEPTEITLFEVSTTEEATNIVSKYETDINVFYTQDGTGVSNPLDIYDWNTNKKISAHKDTNNNISGINLLIDSSKFPNNYMYFTKKISITGDNLLVGLRTFTDTWSSQSIVFSLIDAADTTLLNEILTDTGIQSAVYTSSIPISGNYNSQGTTLNKYFGELSGVPTGEYFLVLTSTTNNTGNFIMNYLSIINIKDGE